MVVYPEGGVYIDNFILKASIAIAKPKLAEYELETADPTGALKGKRNVFWEGAGFVDSNIYDYSLLHPGNVIQGPAVIEAEYTTIVVPPHLNYIVDKYNIARLVGK